MQLLTYICVAIVPVAFGSVDWPSDFWDQVAANHPAPSGSQVAVSASPAEVDARTATVDTRVVYVPGFEGRAVSFWDSDEWPIDPKPKPPGTVIIVR